MKRLNWFKNNDGRKLNKLQTWLVRNVEWRVEVFLNLIPFLIYFGIVIYIIVHLIVEHW